MAPAAARGGRRWPFLCRERERRGRDDRLWDLASGACVRTLEGHTDTVTALALSGDGRWLLSGSNDKSVRLWVPPSSAHDEVGTLGGATCRHPQGRPPQAFGLEGGTSQFRSNAALAFTHTGKPVWTEAQFQDLLRGLAEAGFGWLRPPGVRAELERMAARRPKTPPAERPAAATPRPDVRGPRPVTRARAPTTRACPGPPSRATCPGPGPRSAGCVPSSRPGRGRRPRV